MDALTLLSAAASGLAVLAITWLADRLGGTLGGLLATAPVTTTAAMVYLASVNDTQTMADAAIAGGRALFVVLLAMPAYFFFLKHTTGALRTRITGGVLAFVVLFTVGGLALGRLQVTPWLWIALSVALSVGYLFSFLRAHIPPRLLRGAKPRLAWPEALLRFGAGAGIILVVDWLRSVNTTIANAWTVFPGTFLVTLAVLGYARGAAFSARAAQGGAMGGLPFVAYLLTLWLVLPLGDGFAWAAAMQVPAWIAYFATLVPLWKWRQRTLAAAVPRVPTSNGQ